jgi:uncharacterized protein YkwD
MGKRKVVKNSKDHKTSKKTKREFELLGGTTVFVSAALVISIFLASSLDVVIIRSQQYASVVATTLVDLANRERVENRLDSLTLSPALTKAAQLKANDMAQKSYFAHVSPDGTEPWHWFEEAGYKFAYAGENLAIDFSDSDAVNKAWMNSPTHRANILEQNYTEIGIATAEGVYQGRPTTFVVQEFGRPLEDKKAAKTVASSLPNNPTETATAQNVPSTQVLGESTGEVSAQDRNNDASQYVDASMSVTYASPIEHAVASPNQTLKYLYYAIGTIVLILLAFATGFEIHIRHMKTAAGAGFLFALMLFLFFFGTKIIFVPPSVPAEASMAAVAKAL